MYELKALSKIDVYKVIKRKIDCIYSNSNKEVIKPQRHREDDIISSHTKRILNSRVNHSQRNSKVMNELWLLLKQ